MSDTNGSSATRAEVSGLRNEMIARFDANSSQITEVKGELQGLRKDLQKVLLVQAGEEAVSKIKYRISTRWLAWAGIASAMLAPLAWNAHIHV